MSTLRANTLKPITSGNSLVLQGDSGGSGVSGPSIDSNGDVDFSQNTDAKVKLPSGGGIYESDGSTEILTESGGAVSLQNVDIASNVTGFTGIKALDIYYLNSAITGAGFIAHGNFTRGSASIGMANFGSAVSLHNETAGVFTFPSTGIWKIELKTSAQLNGVNRIMQSQIYVAPDGKTGTFVLRGKSFTNIHADVSTTYTNDYAFCYIDVTTAGDTASSSAVKFYLSIGGASTIAESSNLTSAVIFTRLGDT